MTDTPTLSIDELIALFDDYNVGRLVRLDMHRVTGASLRTIKARIERLEGALHRIANLAPDTIISDTADDALVDTPKEPVVRAQDSAAIESRCLASGHGASGAAATDTGGEK